MSQVVQWPEYVGGPADGKPVAVEDFEALEIRVPDVPAVPDYATDRDDGRTLRRAVAYRARVHGLRPAEPGSPGSRVIRFFYADSISDVEAFALVWDRMLERVGVPGA